MALPDSTDQAILDAIVTGIKTITAGADYNTNFGDEVFNDRSTPFKTDGVNVRESGDQLAEEQVSSGDLHDIYMDVDIDIINKGATTDLRKKKNDILKYIGLNDTWGALAIGTEYFGSIKEPLNHLGDKLADLRISIRIHYRKNAWSK